MSLFDKSSKKKFGKWVNSATKKELENAYENERQSWIKHGAGDKTPLMKSLDKAISKLSAEEWEKDPRRNKNPNYRWTDKNRWDKD